MEILNFESTAKSKSKKNPLGLLLSLASVIAVATFGSTLAEGVTVSSGAITFGQGVAQATACDNAITLTPGAEFTNAAGGGTFNLKTVQISDLDATACNGKTFIIKAWGNTGNALTLASGVAAITSVVNATKASSTATTGVTVSSSATTQILYTITTPTLSAGDVYKLTIEQQS